jgi:hypothetical protein
MWGVRKEGIGVRVGDGSLIEKSVLSRVYQMCAVEDVSCMEMLQLVKYRGRH